MQTTSDTIRDAEARVPSVLWASLDGPLWVIPAAGYYIAAAITKPSGFTGHLIVLTGVFVVGVFTSAE